MTMTHYARVADGLVVEVKDLPAEGAVLAPAAINEETGEAIPASVFSLNDLFGPDHGWVAAPAEVGPGWRRIGASGGGESGQSGYVMTVGGGAFAPPQPIVESDAPPRLTFNQFMDLFTSDEQTAIAGAAMADVATKLWYDRAVGANFIDMADPRTTGGLQKMVDAKLISSKRRDRVLKGLAPG